jgi:ribosome-binding protein aMBF1 (putative translation factor)
MRTAQAVNRGTFFASRHCRGRKECLLMTRPTYKDKYAPHFGAIVQRLRKQRGWTIQFLARRAGMNSNHLGDLEKGVNIPNVRTIMDLAQALDVRASDIVEEVETMFRPRSGSAQK